MQVVKVDRSLVSSCLSGRECAAIVQATTAMAHAMGLRVVAEGVESEEQRAFLGSCACDFIQGHLTGAPLDADSAAKDFI